MLNGQSVDVWAREEAARTNEGGCGGRGGGARARATICRAGAAPGAHVAIAHRPPSSHRKARCSAITRGARRFVSGLTAQKQVGSGADSEPAPSMARVAPPASLRLTQILGSEPAARLFANLARSLDGEPHRRSSVRIAT